jgi:hypothetical protein
MLHQLAVLRHSTAGSERTRSSRVWLAAARFAARIKGDIAMKGVLAWVIGIPIPIIIVLYLLDVF